MSSQMPLGDPELMREMISEFLGEDVGDPYDVVQDTLNEIRGLGGELADAAEEIGGMFDRLAGEGSESTPESSYDSEQQETLDALQEILGIVKQAK
ncbi:hypothetical protein [Novipirellula sp.]|uniref:hypothetical protein n=1 Tax=Novipirellula sp. TaxID=2795430 RepID=UPI0035640F04